MGLIGTTKKMFDEHGANFVYAGLMYKLFRKGNIKYDLKWKDNVIHGNNHVASWATYNEVLANGSYDFPVENASTIVDLGANIGYSAVYFKDRYPESKVICVEPEKENLMYLYKNVSNFKQIYVEEQPIWDSEKQLSFTPGECSPSHIFDDAKNSGGFKSITMPMLMNKYGLTHIDILKIDIEGGEIPVLTSNNDWLEHVDNIYIEIHSMIHANIGSVYHAPKIFKALEEKGFELKQMKEGLYWFVKPIIISVVDGKVPPTIKVVK